MRSAHYLQMAVEADRFVSSLRVDTDHGVRWRRSTDPAAPAENTLYHGSAGILLHQLELHAALADSSHLDLAVAAGDDLLASVSNDRRLGVGLFSGAPGHVVALDALWQATAQPKFRDGAVSLLDRLRAQAHSLGAGIGWIEPMPFSDITGFTGDREIYDQSVGAAGAGLVFLHAHRRGLHPDAGAWACAAADRLLEVAERDGEGLRWGLMSDMPFDFRAPNFAHGSAGVAYFLADLYRVTGDQRYLRGAVDGARYVQQHATEVGDGCLVCHTEAQQPPIFYLGVCHGPPGTGRLFHLLHTITGEAEWGDFADALLRGLLATGAPEQRSDGFWNNAGQCCGDAGLGDYLLFLYHRTTDRSYLDLADRVAVEIDRRSESADGARWWVHAEHRARPRFVEAQTGYMQGAAGIGSFLVHLATTLRGAPVKTMLPDHPFSLPTYR